jgi:hypothetical protein
MRPGSADSRDPLDLQNKYLILAEAGNDLIDGSGSSEEIESLKKSFSFVVDILPTKSTIKDSTERSKYRWTKPSGEGINIAGLKAEDFLDPEEEKDDDKANRANEDDILACAADLLNNVTTASSGAEDDDKGQIKDGTQAKATDSKAKTQKVRLSVVHLVKFDAGIDAFVAEQVKAIQEEKQKAKKAEMVTRCRSTKAPTMKPTAPSR